MKDRDSVTSFPAGCLADYWKRGSKQIWKICTILSAEYHLTLSFYDYHLLNYFWLCFHVSVLCLNISWLVFLYKPRHESVTRKKQTNKKNLLYSNYKYPNTFNSYFRYKFFKNWNYLLMSNVPKMSQGFWQCHHLFIYIFFSTLSLAWEMRSEVLLDAYNDSNVSIYLPCCLSLY